jgi:hypothetical protein
MSTEESLVLAKTSEESLKQELATRFGLMQNNEWFRTNIFQANPTPENPMLRIMRLVQMISDGTHSSTDIVPLRMLGRAIDIVDWARVNRRFLRMIDSEPEPANLSLVHDDSNEGGKSGSGLLTQDEINALEKLGLNEHYEVGTYFGPMAIERIE